MNNEYQPFGDEWKKEMMKWSKTYLVNALREALIENKRLLEKIKRIISEEK